MIPLRSRSISPSCASLYDIGIVAHDSRVNAAAELADAVNAKVVSVDDGTLGCEANHRQVWQLTACSARPWTVVLEDDAVPVADFQDQLTAMLRAAPAPIVSLYLGRSRPPQHQARIRRAVSAADKGGANFILATRLLHCVGVAMQTPLVASMVEVTGLAACKGLPIDEAISAWARAHGYGVAYSWPSLVDHADGPTVAYHRDRAPRTAPRIAWRTGQRSAWRTTQVVL